MRNKKKCGCIYGVPAKMSGAFNSVLTQMSIHLDWAISVDL